MSATFLVTGFEPFGEHLTNSSWDALELLRERWPETVVTRRLPVDYLAAHVLLRRTLDELKPRAVLCTGLAKGRVFRIERRARRPAALTSEPGATQVEGRWPWNELRHALDQSGVSNVDSDDAGQYVCESTYWSLLTYAGTASPPEFASFLHVPHTSEEYPTARIAEAVGRVVDYRHTALRLGAAADTR